MDPHQWAQHRLPPSPKPWAGGVKEKGECTCALGAGAGTCNGSTPCSSGLVWLQRQIFITATPIHCCKAWCQLRKPSQPSCPSPHEGTHCRTTALLLQTTHLCPRLPHKHMMRPLGTCPPTPLYTHTEPMPAISKWVYSCVCSCVYSNAGSIAEIAIQQCYQHLEYT